MADNQEVVETGLDDFAPGDPADLMQEEPKNDEPTGEEQSTEEETVEQETEETVETEEEVEEETEENEEPTEEAASDVPKVTVDGVEYPVNAIPPEVALKMATHYGQVGHYQKLYEEAVAQTKQPVQPEQPAEAPKPVKPDDLVKQYKPVVEALKEQGFVGEFLAEEDPAFVASIVHQAAMLEQARALIVMQDQRIRNIEQYAHTEQASSTGNMVVSLLDELASEDEFYAPLKDPQTKKQLFESWGKMFDNVPNREQAEAAFISGILNDPEGPKEGLRKLYFGYAGTSMLDEFKKGKQKATSTTKKRRKRVAGEGASASPMKPATAPVDDNGLDDFAPE